MLKIYGRATSANVQKVMWAIGELGLDHERVDVGGPFGQNGEPWYRGLNPNGVVPTLEEDGFVLWESNACLGYIASKYGPGRLEPSDLRLRASAHRWMDWQLTTLGPAIFPLFWGMIRTPEDQRDMKAIEASRAKTEDCLRVLDRYLGETAFLAGDTFSMGDIPCALFAYRYYKLSPQPADLPNVARWYGAIAQRPAYQEHVLAIPFV
ncbi:MAG TPA: glutathione S-transferase [Xanthobacteraceae bacterium]|nr:glutathione S-transferase [Xanthobacteraceae bacterium]